MSQTTTPAPSAGKVSIALNAGTLGAIVAAVIAAASAWPPDNDVSEARHQQQLGQLTEQVARMGEDLRELKQELREMRRQVRQAP